MARDNFQTENTFLLANKGDPDAQYLLGVMYSKGVGIEKKRCPCSLLVHGSN